ncbi:MAG: hypothetical protein LRY51_00290, partial [Geovibrio sp.]|nr:hypothetical protein [Geovibrio sp.]
NHELVTLLTNPADGTGVRTMDLNYYLNDPIIWGTDVKNITVWLESEIFDLAKAQQKPSCLRAYPCSRTTTSA